MRDTDPVPGAWARRTAWVAAAATVAIGGVSCAEGEFLVWSLAPHAIRGGWILQTAGLLLAFGALGMLASGTGLAATLFRRSPNAPRWLTRAAVSASLGAIPGILTGAGWLATYGPRAPAMPGLMHDAWTAWLLVAGVAPLLATTLLALFRLVAGAALRAGAADPRPGATSRSRFATAVLAIMFAGHAAVLTTLGKPWQELDSAELQGDTDAVRATAARVILKERTLGFRWYLSHVEAFRAAADALTATLPGTGPIDLGWQHSPVVLEFVSTSRGSRRERIVFLLDIARRREVAALVRFAALVHAGGVIEDSRRDPEAAEIRRVVCETVCQIASDPDPREFAHSRAAMVGMGPVGSGTEPTREEWAAEMAELAIDTLALLDLDDEIAILARIEAAGTPALGHLRQRRAELRAPRVP